MKIWKWFLISALALGLSTPSFATTNRESSKGQTGELAALFEGGNPSITPLSENEMLETKGDWGWSGAVVSSALYLVTTPRSQWNATSFAAAGVAGALGPPASIWDSAYWTSASLTRVGYSTAASAAYWSYGRPFVHRHCSFWARNSSLCL